MVQCKEPKGHTVDMLNTQKQEMETIIREYNSNVSTLQSLQNNGGSQTDIQFHQDKIVELLNKAEEINSKYVDKISNLNSQIRNRNSDTNTMSHDVKRYQENIGLFNSFAIGVHECSFWFGHARYCSFSFNDIK